MGLERRDKPGLWIPNTDAERWDPSHPEKHTQLLTADPKDLRVVRARVIRLAKAENKRAGTPPLCSFNLEALGLMFVERGMDEPLALQTLWARGAEDLKRRRTPDPAGVSPPIKVEDQQAAANRLRMAADILAMALAVDDDERLVRKRLARLWADFVAAEPGGATKARTAARLRSRSPMSITPAGMLSTGAGEQLKSVRSFGDPRLAG